MLTLNTNNGGIAIDDFRGTAKFHAQNGGLSLTNVGGDLRGETTNGGVTVNVGGDHWDGAGLDVETRNGGIRLNLPKGFSAELEAGTTHGRISIDFPITVQGTHRPPPRDDARIGRPEAAGDDHQRRGHDPAEIRRGRPMYRPRADTRSDPSSTGRIERSGRSEAWYRVRFGSGRSLVRIQSPRPLIRFS